MGIRPDAPLSDLSGDEYGFTTIAEHVATTISQSAAAAGMGVGIEGAWGSGKTTFVNQIVTYLSRQMPPPLIVKYNAWAAVDETEAAMGLLLELTSVLRTAATHSNLSKGVKNQIKSGVLKITTFFEEHGFDELHKLVKPGKNILRHFMGIGSLEQLKSGIAETLKVLGRRMYVVVDDLDRMAAQHLRVLFATIKTVCDVPDLVFLLALDKQVVANALAQVQGGDGVAYLDKIISLSIPVPYIEPDDLLRSFLVHIVRALNVDPGALRTPQWIALQDVGVGRYLRKPRDVIRLANAITLTYPSVAHDVVMADFIALEALRLFEPAVHSRIKEFLPTLLRRSGTATQSEIDSLIKLSAAENQDGLRRTLNLLFPSCGFENRLSASHEQHPRSVASPGKFAIYFQFGIMPGTLTETEFDNGVTALNTSTVACRDYFRRLIALPLRGSESVAEMFIHRLIESPPAGWYRTQQNNGLIGLAMIEDSQWQTAERRRGPHATGSMLSVVARFAESTLTSDLPPMTAELLDGLRAQGQSILVLRQLIVGFERVADDSHHNHVEEAKGLLNELRVTYMQWLERSAASGILLLLDAFPDLLRELTSRGAVSELRTVLAQHSPSRKSALVALETLYRATRAENEALNGTADHFYRIQGVIGKCLPDEYFDVLLKPAPDEPAWLVLWRGERLKRIENKKHNEQEQAELRAKKPTFKLK